MRSQGTQEKLARRRRRAVEAYREGKSAVTIAEGLGVDRSTVHRWVRLARSPGGLNPKPVPSRHGPSDPQLARLREMLLEGARAYGWADELWTAARVAALI